MPAECFGGGAVVVVFLRWCCGGVFEVVLLWWCFCGGVFEVLFSWVFFVAVLLWYLFFVVLVWWCFCGGVFIHCHSCNARICSDMYHFICIAILAMQGYVSIVSYSLPFLRIFIAMPYEPICIESSRLDLASIRLESIGLERIRL